MKDPKRAVDFFIEYCCRHLVADRYEEYSLYRIFYYDCPPSVKEVYHPLTKKVVKLKESDQYKWMSEFLKELKKKKKSCTKIGTIE